MSERDALNPLSDDADTNGMASSGADQRVSWSAFATDESQPPASPDPSPGPDRSPGPDLSPGAGFEFDLGGALAKLGGGSGPIVPPAPLSSPIPPPEAPEADSWGLPVATPSLADLARLADASPPVPGSIPELPSLANLAPGDPLPQRESPSAPLDPLPQRERTNPRVEAAVATPDLPSRARTAESPVPPGRRSVFDDEATGEARAALHRVPRTANVALDALDKPTLPAPLLPDFVPPKMPPSAVLDTDVPVITAQEVRQFRNAQARAARNRGGRVVGRMLVFLLVFAAAVAAALTVGRQWLFPVEWDPALEALVPAVEVAHGVAFESIVPLEAQTPEVYAGTVARLVLGGDLAQHHPTWRALGIASGAASDPVAAQAAAAAYPALFDPETGTIYHLAHAPADDALAAALDAALAHQTAAAAGVEGGGPAYEAEPGPALLGPRPIRELVADALAGAAPAATAQPVVLPGQLPLPVLYQLEAGPRLASSYTVGSVAALDDARATAPLPVLNPGDTPTGEPVNLGIDDWTLVWANRLPADAVDRLLDSVAGEGFTPFSRGDAACFVGVFETHGEMYTLTVMNELSAWVAGAPLQAQAAVGQVGPTTVQFAACDPGETPQAVNAAAVDAVLARQLARLGR